MGPLRPISFADAKRKLNGAGFHEVGTTDSHVKFAKRTSEGLRTAVVPFHREIAIGTIRSFLRQAGISIDEWLELK